MVTIPNKLNEFNHAEDPARRLLEQLGWIYVPAATLASERPNEREVLLKDRLRAALLRLNDGLTGAQVVILAGKGCAITAIPQRWSRWNIAVFGSYQIANKSRRGAQIAPDGPQDLYTLDPKIAAGMLRRKTFGHCGGRCQPTRCGWAMRHNNNDCNPRLHPTAHPPPDSCQFVRRPRLNSGGCLRERADGYRCDAGPQPQLA